MILLFILPHVFYLIEVGNRNKAFVDIFNLMIKLNI